MFPGAKYTELIRTHSRDVVIDEYIGEKLVSLLYEKWDNSWDEPLDFGAAGVGITCAMVLNVPIETLTKVYGKKNAGVLKQVAAQYTTGV